ncbi:hypothetical protein CSKR_109542 [Clonorchis sinensis]|uniref:Uncharacterized protein n=1 Tax=Clonorchis sinensis TaxID=79923 RepID=A0A3R7CXT6_CLOSI|nr:hypothetical protein CSKR_109542 [Clonorchis sinensis]
MLNASEFSHLSRRMCSRLSDVIGGPDPSNDDSVTVLVLMIDFFMLISWLECDFTARKARGSNSTSASRLPPSLGLGNLAVSQPSCFLRVAWQLGTQKSVTDERFC